MTWSFKMLHKVSQILDFCIALLLMGLISAPQPAVGQDKKVVPPQVVGKHGMAVQSLAFSSDGNLMVSGSYDYEITLWDVSAKEVKRQNISRPRRVSQLVIEQTLRQVCISPDGKLLASGSMNRGEVTLWDAGHGIELKVFRGHPNQGYVTFSPDGKKIVESGWGTHCYESTEGRKQLWAADDAKVINNKVRDVNGPLAFSPDGKLLAVFASHGIVLLDATTGKVARVVTDIHGSALAFSTDNKSLACLTTNREIKIFDSTAGNEIRTFTGLGLGTIAFSPDGKKLASGGKDAVLVWDVATGNVIHKLASLEDAVEALAFSPKGGVLATGDKGGNIKLWRIPD